MKSCPSRILHLGLCLLGGLSSLPAETFGKDPARPLELVGSDAALVLEVQRPKSAWEKFRQGELFHRLERFAPYQQLLKSDGYRHWQQMEQAVADATGAPLSSQLLDLWARELVLTVYFSADNRPEGVLLSQSETADVVQRFLETWQKLEPNVSPQPLSHRGQMYFLRPAHGSRHTNTYYVALGAVVAISDQEARIRQVIELHQADPAKSSQRLTQDTVYRRAVPPADKPAAVRLTLLARPWVKVWQDAAQSDAGAVLLRRFWPAIEALTLELHAEEGLHLAGRLFLNPDRTDDLWKAWSAATPSPHDFLAAVPKEAVLAAAGGVHLKPLWKFLRDLAPERDRESWEKGRRIARGFLGGRDLIDDVLPALASDMGLYLVPAAERDSLFPYDGVAVFRFPNDEKSAGLHLALDQAFSAGMALLSIQSAEQHPDREAPVVRSDVAEGKIVRWLDTSLPVRVAYQLTPTELTVSRSVKSLRRHLAAQSSPSASTAFSVAQDKWFPECGPFVYVAARKLREEKNTGGVEPPRPWIEQVWQLLDGAYVGAKFEGERATIRMGAVVEAAP